MAVFQSDYASVPVPDGAKRRYCRRDGQAHSPRRQKRRAFERLYGITTGRQWVRLRRRNLPGWVAVVQNP